MAVAGALFSLYLIRLGISLVKLDRNVDWLSN
jgi:hypothetical protein